MAALENESTEAVAQRCSVKKDFLKVLQNSQENTCTRLKPSTLLKKRLWHRCFPVNFAKFLRTPFFTEHLWWLLLKVVSKHSIKFLYRSPVAMVTVKLITNAIKMLVVTSRKL